MALNTAEIHCLLSGPVSPIFQVAPSAHGVGAGVPAAFPLSFFDLWLLWQLHVHGPLPESAENRQEKLMCQIVGVNKNNAACLCVSPVLAQFNQLDTNSASIF